MDGYSHKIEEKNIDCSYTNNFDEEYLNFFPKFSKEKFFRSVTQYPDFSYKRISQTIKEKFGVDHIILGSGVEQIIILLNTFFSLKSLRVGIVCPIFYRVLETSRRPRILSLSDLKLGKLCGIEIVWIQNPNLFSGDLLKPQELEVFLQRNKKTIFVIDEAAMFVLPDWKEQTALGLIKRNKNLIVICSFSKIYGLSGLRASFAAGIVQIFKDVSKFNLTFPFSNLTQDFLEAFLNQTIDDFLDRLREQIVLHKKLMKKKLATLNIEVYADVANCLFLRTKGRGSLYRRFLEIGILTTKLSRDGRRIRMTVHSSKRKQNKILKRISKLSYAKINESRSGN